MIKSIALVNPPNDMGSTGSGNSDCYPHLGLMSIASYLTSKKDCLGVESLEILDSIHPLEVLEARATADLVGISVLAANYKNALRIARAAAKAGSIVVFGNDYATVRAFEILTNRPEVDFIVVGDAGETTLAELVNCLNTGGHLSAVANLCFRTKTGEVVLNPKRPQKLADLPAIRRDLIDDYTPYFNNYNQRYGKWHQKHVYNMSTNFAKGCSWGERKERRCLYCDIADLKMDHISPLRIWDEVRSLQNGYGVNWIYEVCDSFTSLDRIRYGQESHLETLANSRPDDVDVGWFVYARAGDINASLLDKLEKIGVERLNIGFDSGDDEMLKSLSKGIGSEENLKALETVFKRGFQLYCSVVVGSLGESPESLGNTVDFIRQACEMGNNKIVALTVSALLPLPGSRAWAIMNDPSVRMRECDRLGYKLAKSADIKDKFAGLDVLDLREVSDNWVESFCIATPAEVQAAVDKIQNMVEKSGAYSDGFGIPPPPQLTASQRPKPS